MTAQLLLNSQTSIKEVLTPEQLLAKAAADLAKASELLSNQKNESAPSSGGAQLLTE